MIDPLYSVKCTCFMCGNEYTTSRVRPSFKKPSGRDSDFCLHYTDINPEYYVVRVCRYCGFASTENFTMKISESQKKKFLDTIGMNWTGRDYGGERSWRDALETYKLALLCAQIKEESSRVVAGILHHIAWMYRYKGMKEMEDRFLKHALEAYTSLFEGAESELNDAKLMYLIGELNRRLGNYHEAVRWFSRVVHDKRIMDANMIRASREQWALITDELRSAQTEKNTASSL